MKPRTVVNIFAVIATVVFIWWVWQVAIRVHDQRMHDAMEGVAE